MGGFSMETVPFVVYATHYMHFRHCVLSNRRTAYISPLLQQNSLGLRRRPGLALRVL